MCLLSSVFKSCLLSSMSSGLLVIPGVSALPCLTLMSSLKTIILKYLLVCVFLLPPCCVHCDRRPDSKRPFTSFCFVRFSSGYFVPVFCPLRQASPLAASPHARRSRLSHPAVRGSSREFTPPFVAQPSRRSWEFTPPFTAQPSRRSREFTPPFADQPAHRSQEMTPPSTANPSPPARRWLDARRPASDSSPPDRSWLKPAGSPLTHAAGHRSRGKLIHHALSITPPSAAHRPRRSREITPPSVGKANPPSAAPSSSRGRPTRRPWSLGPPPAVASSSPPAPAVEWSSQPVMVPPAGRGRIWPDCDQGLFKSCFRVCLVPEGSWYPWAAPWIFFGGVQRSRL